MWALDYKEGWALKSWCFWNVVLEKTVESPLDSREIKPVNSKGNQPWIFIGRSVSKAEAPILWPPDVEKILILERLMAGKGGEIDVWHHWLNGHEYEQTPGDSGGQRSLAGYSPWGHRESDMAEQLNNIMAKDGALAEQRLDRSWEVTRRMVHKQPPKARQTWATLSACSGLS